MMWRQLLDLRLQKHERQAVRVISEVAEQYGVGVRIIRRGRHPIKAVLSGPGGQRTIGLPGSPRDPHHAVRVAGNQAREACRAIAAIS